MNSDNISNSSLNSSVSSASSSNVSAKLRRLKIQEDLLIQSIKKNSPDSSCGDNKFIKSHLEFKKFVSSLRKSNADIKQLFEDVKCTTQSKDILRSIDIDDVKKDVRELEDKIKCFKTFLQKELTELKQSEGIILRELDETKQNHKIKKYTKVTTKSFSDIVPSPVKNIINSPFKSPEVQRFQDFISNSNKRGGWNEYNHNIFVRIWQKYFPEDEHFDTEEKDYCKNSSFIDEVFEKVTGINRNDIFSHIKWYSKYLYLKKCQANALAEWRAKTKPKKIQPNNSSVLRKENTSKINGDNRKKTVKTAGSHGKQLEKLNYFSDDSTMYSTSSNNDTFYDCVDANEFFKEMNSLRNREKEVVDNIDTLQFRFAKSTKQWENRCSSAARVDTHIFSSNVDDISKLQIPPWRYGLSRKE